MLVLEEKGITDYPNTLCSLWKKEYRSPEVLKINPRGQLPAMKIGPVAVNDSMAAVDCLEDVYCDQGTPLYPKDPSQLAKVHQRKCEKEMRGRKQAFKTELQYFESYLEQEGPHGYLAGKEFSMADVAFFPYLAFFVRVGLKMDKFPSMKDYYERVCMRPSIQKTWPLHWTTKPPSTDILASI